MSATERSKPGTVSLLRNMLRLTQRFRPAAIGAVFDVKRSTTFRAKIHAEYKAQRPEPPSELVNDFALAIDAVKSMRDMNVEMVQVEGHEADDVLASYAAFAKQRGVDTIVVSPDKDLMQIVDTASTVRLFNPVKGVFLDEGDVENMFGVSRGSLVPHVQAFAGDSSDNIPGVPQIGVKSAALLINAYGSYENVLERLKVDGKLTECKLSPKRVDMIRDFADNVPLSYALAKLRTDITMIPDTLFGFCQDGEESIVAMPESRFSTCESFLAHNDFQSMLGLLRSL